jgi:tRNA(Ile)-lysidine synthetase-like protein
MAKAVPERVDERVERFVSEHELIPLRGEITCLVSGGADSTCLWHVLGELGYRVSAVHVDHGLRGEESDADARHCREVMGAEVISPGDKSTQGATEAGLRAIRYELTEGRGLRATGHTASDQVETVLYRMVSSGTTKAIKPRREDGVVRPLLPIWREETEAYCREHGLPFRTDSSNRDTKRGLIREEILPLLRRLHPAAERNLLALAAGEPRLPRALEKTLAELLAVREYDMLRLEGSVEFGPWRLESDAPGLVVRTRRPGDRLAGRRKKVQDLFVDAKVPSSERDDWPLVVSGDDVVSVPGIAEAPGWEGVVRAWKDEGR